MSLAFNFLKCCFILLILIYDKIRFSLAVVCPSGLWKNCSLKYTTRTSRKVSLFVLSRLTRLVCQLLLKHFSLIIFPLDSRKMLRLSGCAVPTRMGSPKSICMRSRNKLKKNAFFKGVVLSFIVDNFFLWLILVPSPTAYTNWRWQHCSRLVTNN